MKTIENSKAKDLFKKFVNGEYESLDEFIGDLRELEDQYIETFNSQNELWFKFSKDDTMATDINDLNRDLRSESPNHIFILYFVVSAVISDTLEVYFS